MEIPLTAVEPQPILFDESTFTMNIDSVKFIPQSIPVLTRRQRCKRGYPHILDRMRRFAALLALGCVTEAWSLQHALWVTPTKRSKQRSLAARMERAMRQIERERK